MSRGKITELGAAGYIETTTRNLIVCSCRRRPLLLFDSPSVPSVPFTKGLLGAFGRVIAESVEIYVDVGDCVGVLRICCFLMH